MSTLKILVVEDDAIVAEDIRQCLSFLGHIVLGPAYHAESAKALVQQTKPHLALLDIDLSTGEDGISLAKWLKTNFPLPVIFLTAFADQFTLERAKAVHPEYYLIKPFNSTQLKVAIEIAGFNYYEPDIQQQHTFKIHRFVSQLKEPLSCRETDVLKLLEQGLNNRKIAENLYLSEHTVKSHLKNIFLKADIKSRAELISKINHA
jgi:DNA-binding NarL/FixJ family response regulator